MVPDRPRRLALHPHRKRNFFLELAELLDEEPREVRPIQDAFPALKRPETAAPKEAERDANGPQEDSKSATTAFVASNSLTSDSFDLVEFGAPRTRSSGTSQSSHNESMADSLLFLPGAMSSSPGSNDPDRHHHDRHVRFQFQVEKEQAISGDKAMALPATTLVNSELLADSTLTSVRLELADYYDVDRMCELSPCWLRNDGASCEIHRGVIRRPMLLFCLQALDEFIGCNEFQGLQRWRVQACKVARRVFTSMWESDVLGLTADQDIVLTDYVTRKMSLVGVAGDVWRVIAWYWDKYKQSYLHQQELYFTDGTEGNVIHAASKWSQVRELLYIYGMKPKQAVRLIERQTSGSIDVCKLTAKQLSVVAQGLPSIEHLRVGMEYLGCGAATNSSHGQDSANAIRRPMISQQDGKTAFSAILIHLKKWNDEVQVFPCGSFSRGAAFVSVLDVLVAVPLAKDKSSPSAESDASSFQQVVTALTAAKVVREGVIRPLSKTRGVCIVPFKMGSILLDLKVFRPPRSWLALLYFTGPETFVVSFFSDLLKRSLREVADTSFECIYASVQEVLGKEALLSIESEKDLFDTMDREYLLPTDRD